MLLVEVILTFVDWDILVRISSLSIAALHSAIIPAEVIEDFGLAAVGVIANGHPIYTLNP